MLWNYVVLVNKTTGMTNKLGWPLSWGCVAVQALQMKGMGWKYPTPLLPKTTGSHIPPSDRLSIRWGCKVLENSQVGDGSTLSLPTHKASLARAGVPINVLRHCVQAQNHTQVCHCAQIRFGDQAFSDSKASLIKSLPILLFHLHTPSKHMQIWTPRTAVVSPMYLPPGAL